MIASRDACRSMETLQTETDRPPVQLMATCSVSSDHDRARTLARPSRSSRAAVIDAPAIWSTYSAMPTNGGQSCESPKPSELIRRRFGENAPVACSRSSRSASDGLSSAREGGRHADELLRVESEQVGLGRALRRNASDARAGREGFNEGVDWTSAASVRGQEVGGRDERGRCDVADASRPLVHALRGLVRHAETPRATADPSCGFLRIPSCAAGRAPNWRAACSRDHQTWPDRAAWLPRSRAPDLAPSSVDHPLDSRPEPTTTSAMRRHNGRKQIWPRGIA